MKRRILFAIIFFITLLYNCKAQSCFNVTTLPSFSCTLSICTADFNNDGNNDLAIGNFTSSSISVYLGTGGGNFGTSTIYPSNGSDLTGITTADFNGDNILDLAVANCNTYDMAILFGTGSGAFGAATNYIIGGPGSGYLDKAITSADFNGDGKVDIATAGDNNVIAVFFNTGSGSFGTATYYLLTANNGPHDIIAADLNNDGIMDLATANSTANNTSVLLGTGSGTFSTPVDYPAGMANGITSADLNSDGNKDLITANADSGNVSVLLGTGTGTFSTSVNYAAGNSASYPVVADFDQDCFLDIAVTPSGSNNVVILRGDGTGSFGSPILFPTTDAPWQICMADFDKDGRMDLATSLCNGVGLLMNCSNTTCGDAVNEINKRNFSVYPNPAADQLLLKLPVNNEKAIVIIQNALGQTVKEQSYSEVISVSGLAPGCYQIKVLSSQGETYQAKFIKQ